MAEKTYLIFHDVNGKPDLLKEILLEKADNYICLGGLIKSEVRTHKELDLSLECLAIMASEPYCMLMAGDAENRLIDKVRDAKKGSLKEKDSSLAERLVSIKKEHLKPLFNGIIGPLTKIETPYPNRILFNTFLPNAFDIQLRDTDSFISSVEKKVAYSDLNELDDQTLTKNYGPLFRQIINYLSKKERSNLFFSGGREECIVWQRGLENAIASTISLNNHSNRIFKKLIPGSIVLPGSARKGFFCKYDHEEGVLELIYDDTLDQRFSRLAKHYRGA